MHSGSEQRQVILIFDVSNKHPIWQSICKAQHVKFSTCLL